MCAAHPVCICVLQLVAVIRLLWEATSIINGDFSVATSTHICSHTHYGTYRIEADVLKHLMVQVGVQTWVARKCDLTSDATSTGTQELVVIVKTVMVEMAEACSVNMVGAEFVYNAPPRDVGSHTRRRTVKHLRVIGQ